MPPNADVEPIATRCAHWGWDEHQYFGYRVFGELLGSESLTGLTALSVLGRRLDGDALALLDDAAVALTLADPRIWPLKLSRTLASYGGSIAGAAGGLVVQGDSRIGPWTVQKAAELLAAWHARLCGGHETPEAVVRDYLRSHRFVWGFGTPFRPKDERLVAFERRVEVRGRDQLGFWKLFRSASEVVQLLRATPPNMGMGVAAALLDLGVRPSETGTLATALMFHMFVANAMEGASAPSDTLRQLPDGSISYKGRAPRSSPVEASRCEGTSSSGGGLGTR